MVQRSRGINWGCCTPDITCESQLMVYIARLLPDATSRKHLGQGANQAFEDVYHLIRILLKHHKDPQVNPTTEELSAIFKEFESIRIERTTALVQRAHDRGNKVRVVTTEEEASQRDKYIREKWSNMKDGCSEFEKLALEPYDEISVI